MEKLQAGQLIDEYRSFIGENLKNFKKMVAGNARWNDLLRRTRHEANEKEVSENER